MSRARGLGGLRGEGHRLLFLWSTRILDGPATTESDDDNTESSEGCEVRPDHRRGKDNENETADKDQDASYADDQEEGRSGLRLYFRTMGVTCIHMLIVAELGLSTTIGQCLDDRRPQAGRPPDIDTSRYLSTRSGAWVSRLTRPT